LQQIGVGVTATYKTMNCRVSDVINFVKFLVTRVTTLSVWS